MMDFWQNVKWIREKEGSYVWAAERYLPELAASGLFIDQVVHPKSILDIQPTHLGIDRPFTKEDMLYLPHVHRLQFLGTNTSDLFNDMEVYMTCLDRLKTLEVDDIYIYPQLPR